MYPDSMLLLLLPLFGAFMIVTMFALAIRAERDLYCDHGPSEYDSYCPKCGIDS